MRRPPDQQGRILDPEGGQALTSRPQGAGLHARALFEFDSPARLARGWQLDELDLRLIITNLAVLDFGGPDHQVQLRTLHPGVTAAQVQEATGFALHVPAHVPETAAPTDLQLALLARLDPHNLRATALG